ncbi:hypothetical protein AUC69_02375 [Methyloceanibacter superfactus]|uniref:Molybdopterin molybdenumtransferase n=1 Tax=Methyloceanibacter superfactus TaxID=1774969 RepID=A0A1E3VPA5_9HYPH|nr:gephyrin-like molybdotransferase Glp [Methyloceanibacter superfactus]ODR95378.1 hypothetical protein AUC69_02375 [Methyloceanibacter superfactus]
MALLSVDEALARVLTGLAPLEAEQVSIADAYERVLAEDVAATLTQPPFDASAMDGYAVRAADVAVLPATLDLIGEAAAGARFSGTLGQGQAVRIFTGAPVPDGADTIAIQENAEERDGRVVVKEAASGRHIRPRGQDFEDGQVLLTRARSSGLGRCWASANHAELPVTRKPTVAILATGDEVVPPGSELGPDQIVSSVGYGLAGLGAGAWGRGRQSGIAKDDRRASSRWPTRAPAPDILVTIGGASVGERDLVANALRDEGLKLDFAKVAMRPGKPVLFGRLGAQRLLGLPGNPVSALICAQVFLVPMLHRMLGLAEAGQPEPEAVLGAALPANGDRQNYLRAMSVWSDDGTRVVRPLPSQDSSLVAAFTRADCLILRTPNAPALPQGAAVKIIPFSD